MGRFNRANLALGLGVAILGLMIATIWVSMDTASGLIEKVRRQVTIGDALAPTAAAMFLVVGGLLVAAFDRDDTAYRVSVGNLAFVTSLLILLFVSLALMRWAGPLAAVFAEGGYRPLRDTAPWKYIGFSLGGTALVAGLICFVERRLSWRAIWVALVATLALILVYDLPFDDLLLPPNGDV